MFKWKKIIGTPCPADRINTTQEQHEGNYDSRSRVNKSPNPLNESLHLKRPLHVNCC